MMKLWIVTIIVLSVFIGVRVMDFGVASGVGSLATSGINMLSQHMTNKHNEKLMRESWAREDNAVGRRVADLKANGLNPILAAGSAASSSGPIQASAPQMSENPGTAYANGVMQGAQKDLVIAQKDIADANAVIANHDANIIKNSPLTSTQMNSNAGALSTLAQALINELRNGGKGQNFLDNIFGPSVGTNSQGVRSYSRTQGKLDNANNIQPGARGTVLRSDRGMTTVNPALRTRISDPVGSGTVLR